MGETRTMRAVAQRSLKLSLAAMGRHMSISRVSCAATVLRVPRLQPFGMPARTLCSGADISKTTLIDIYNEIGNEARQVMLQAEDSIRKEVDSKLAQGMGMDLAASMYGHQMATYMAEFLPLPERTDSVVQRIRAAVISKQKVSETQVDTAFKVFEKDHEVQLVLQTMYQHKLDEAVLPEALNKNISGKSSAYMTDNQKKEMDNARQAVPTIAVFTAQYQALNEGGVTYKDKLLADLMFAVWPRAQQANAQLQQRIQDAQMSHATATP